MRRRSVLGCILVLLVIGVLPPLLFITIRTSSSTPPAPQVGFGMPVQQAVESDPLTIGVILSGPAAASGWGGLVPDNVDFGRVQIPGATAILYDRVNLIDRPGITLDWVVDAMEERGARVIFIAEGHSPSATQDTLADLYPNVVFVMNLSTRSEVEAMLPALSPGASDGGQTTQPAIEQPVQTADSATSWSPVRALIVGLVLALAALSVVIRSGRARLRPVPDGPGMAQSLIDRIATLGAPEKRKKKRGSISGTHGRGLAIERAAREKATDFAALGLPTPVTHVFSTYVLGDKLFDETFAVEQPAGSSHQNSVFLGQCGVSIAAPVNKYDPERVAALEVWLFDQNAAVTENVILASEYALRDSTLKRALYQKGHSLLAIDEDVVAELETPWLRLRLRVLSMGYGFSDTLAQRSFLDYATIELAVWEK